jgi:hypothetical protein
MKIRIATIALIIFTLAFAGFGAEQGHSCNKDGKAACCKTESCCTEGATCCKDGADCCKDGKKDCCKKNGCDMKSASAKKSVR